MPQAQAQVEYLGCILPQMSNLNNTNCQQIKIAMWGLTICPNLQKSCSLCETKTCPKIHKNTFLYNHQVCFVDV